MSHGRRGGDGFRSGADALADAFYPVYRWVFDDSSDFLAEIDRKLAEARMAETVELYVSRAIGVGALVGGVLWAVGVLVGYVLFVTGVVPTDVLLGMPMPDHPVVDVLDALKVPTLVAVTGVVFGAFGFALGFGGLLAVPYYLASEREREINMLLPDAVAFMYALSIGGLNQLEILDAMAKADDTYGEVALEFRTIVQETEYFDTDYRTAVRNRALETPSDEFSQFLTDMLSIINSGGNMTDFLSDKKDKHLRTAKQQQELTLETLELFGEMYMTLSLFPLLLIIVLVIMGMLGNPTQRMLYGTVYGLIPVVGVGFIVLVAMVKQDEPGDGYLSLDDGTDPEQRDPSLLDLGLVERYVGEFAVFDRVKSQEGTHETIRLLKHPHHFFRDNPTYVLGLSVPATLMLVASAVLGGAAPTAWDGFVANPIWGTFLYAYVPIYLICVPLMVFYEWNVRSRRVVVSSLSDTLRKLSSANDTGLTILESVRTVADTSSGKLAEEFDVIHAKVHYGTSLKAALVEFNNKYHIPRLARTVKLVSKAQEASSQITAVLSTAAQASENQDEIERERKSRTRMQVVIILMTYFTLLAVMAILKTQFLDVMAGLSSQSGDSAASGPAGLGGNVDTAVLSLLFFHAVTIQAVISGLVGGYIRDSSVMSAMKYVVLLSTITLVVWMGVG